MSNYWWIGTDWDKVEQAGGISASADPRLGGSGSNMSYAQAKAAIQQIFRDAGVIPGPGRVAAIIREVRSGKRTLGQVRQDVAWVRNYLTKNPSASTSGHRLVNPPTTTSPGQGRSTDQPVDNYSPTDSDLRPAGPSRETLYRQAQALFPYFPKALLDAWVDGYVEFGDPDLAIAQVRQNPIYDKIFPGLRRDDGSLRMTEGEYFSWVEGYKSRYNSFGVPASALTTARISQLIEGGVDPVEFGQRLDTIYTRVATNLPEVRAAYARDFGISVNSLSLGSLLGSAFDPDLNPVELEFRIRRAHITGEADVAGFNIPVAESTRLAEFGLDQQAARTFYSQARTLLPRLGDLVERHRDPDDDFDLGELTDALVFLDPEQEERINRLFSQEQSLFSTTRLFSLRDGALPGLTAD